ncbi:hypothetical protein [Solibacillus sp. FSL K6-1523]|uniref:hypothetical protein n=1 Tax=Solibacillus sp. FSL K6-1523 TaxID=2921471 RepID=UPI0030F7A462
MEEKFKSTLQAIIKGTKDYKITWEYLSDGYYDNIEACYDRKFKYDDRKFKMSFDSGFEVAYEGLLFLLLCIDVKSKKRKKKKNKSNDNKHILYDVEEMFELRIYPYDVRDKSIIEAIDFDFESTLLLFNSLEEKYEQELQQLYSLAAGSASGADRVMDKIINELGNEKNLPV